MKTVKIITWSIVLIAVMRVVAQAQEQQGVNPPEHDPWIQKLTHFNRLDSSVRPITDQEVLDFCELFRKIPIGYESQEQEKLVLQKIRSARLLYGECRNPEQKKQILDMMIELFPKIQEIRDSLGVRPFSKSESYLYVAPPLRPLKEGLSPSERMLDDQQRRGERMTQVNKLSAAIGRLESIHAYLHLALTKIMKIPVEGVSPTLERSPAEKARTKEVLEKQAAARGQRPPQEKKDAP